MEGESLKFPSRIFNGDFSLSTKVPG